MTWVDGLVLVVVGISLIIGLFRGFLREVASLAVWVGGIWLVLHYLPIIQLFLTHWISSSMLQYVAIVLGALIGILVSSWLLSKIFRAVLRTAGMGFLDRILGLVFGFVRGVLVVSFLFVIMSVVGVDKSQAFANSVFYPSLKPVMSWMMGRVPGDLRAKIDAETKQITDVTSSGE